MRAEGFFKIFIALILGFVGCIERRPDEIHILPNGFRGLVVIGYNMPFGQPKLCVDEATIFNIPEDGILRVKFDPATGYIDSRNRKYYFDGHSGWHEEVYYTDIDTVVGIRFSGTGVKYVEEDSTVFYEYYVVGRLDSLNIDSILNFQSRIF